MQRREFIKKSAAYSLAGTLTINALGKNFQQNSGPLNPKISSPGSLSTKTVVVKCQGKEVKIHAIQTGRCAVKVSHHTNHVAHFLTPLKITMDKHFTEFFPIWVWVIEHPEGVLVIDTGENSGVMKPDYFKSAGKIVAAYNRKNIRFQITEEDEIGNQLRQLNITNDKIKNVVLTHLHLDHTDGLHHFPGTEIIVNKNEFEKPSGNIPQLYPSWFEPKLVSYKKDFVEVFHQAYPITQKEDVLLIPTEGHTPNHASVLFKTDEFDILFAGDVCYSQQQLLENDLPGINADYRQSCQTYKNVLTYAGTRKLIFLPSHDAEAATRLRKQTPLK